MSKRKQPIDKHLTIFDTKNVKDFYSKPRSNNFSNIRFFNFPPERVSNEDFKEYLCRNAINFTFTEFENYFFKCFKELYIKYPEKIQGR